MIRAAIRNPVVALALAGLVAAAGLWGWSRVPVDAIPDLSDNQVVVWADWPGQSPEDVEAQVTSRLSRDLQGLAGVRTVRGLSLTGSSYVYIIFEDGRDLYDCRQRVLERLGIVSAGLPAGVQARLGPDATAMGQVFAFTLQGPAGVEAGRRLLDAVVVPALSAVPGVAEVAPAGGVVREYQVEIDPARLQAAGVGLDELMAALAASGRDLGAMAVESSGVETMLRGRGFVRSAAEVEAVVVRGDPERGAGLRLGQVAVVQVGGAPRQGILADQRGEHAGAIVAMRVGADPLRVIREVKVRLAGLAPALAREGFVIAPFYDRSGLITETTATLVHTLAEELVVTCLVVALFLLHARASLAVAACLPLGVLFTFLVMHALGLGANIMSLAGIGIAIGVMVDFGIVVTESVTQRLAALQDARRRAGRPAPASPLDPEVVAAVEEGAVEVARPLLTAAATTIIGFLPIFALDDQAGRLFIPLAATKTLAITGAAVFGVLLVPLLCRLLLPPWRLRPELNLALAGLAAGCGFGWFVRDGLVIGLDHDRTLLVLPGLLVAPLVAAAAGFLVHRLGAERLVNHEENPASRVIHVVYDWALTRLLERKAAFLGVLLLVGGAGWLVGLGWPFFSTPLRAGVAALGGDLGALRADRWLAERFPGIGSSFLPPLDEGALLFMPSIPAHGGLGESLSAMETQNRLIAAVPEVDRVMGKLGRAETALDPAPIGMVETVVLLKPYRDWPAHDIRLPDGRTERRPRTLAEVRAVLRAAGDLPGVAPSWLQPIETRVVMLSTGLRSLLALQIQGSDQAELERFAAGAERVIAAVPGAADVQVQREGGKPYWELRLDDRKLAALGLRREDVAAALAAEVAGMPAAWSLEGRLRYALRLRVARELRDDPDELALVRVPLMKGGGAMEGGFVPLRSLAAAPQVHTVRCPGPAADLAARLPLEARRAWTPLAGCDAELLWPADEPLPEELAAAGCRVVAVRPHDSVFTPVIGPMAIRSESGRRVQHVLFNASGRAEVELVGDAARALEQAVAEGRLVPPKGATWRFTGRYEQKLKADRTMRWVIAVSLLVMTGLIAVGTRSWLVTGIIVACNLGVTTAGGFLAVSLAGAELTTAVMVGFLVLMGVMFNDGILLGSYLHEQFREPARDVADVRHRVFLAGLRRRRPALMTNLTTLLSLVPVLWAEGRGAELMRPMCLPVIGGMTLDLVSLFSVPVVYAWWRERELRSGAKGAGRRV